MYISPDDIVDDNWGAIAPPANLRELKCFQVAKYVDSYASQHGGNTPTINHLAKHFKISGTAVTYHLDMLRTYGLAVRKDDEFILVGSVYSSPEWLK